MRRLTLAAIGVFILGLVLLAYSVYRQEATAYIFVFIPVLQSSSPLAVAGTFLVFAGIFLYFLSLSSSARPEPARPAQDAQQASSLPTAPAGKKFGGVVFLGPIPIIFGSDSKMAKWMLVLAAVVVVLLIILVWYWGSQSLR